MQDLHDTLRAWEDSPDGETYNVIIQSAGKEDLGGGVLVGITSTLQNAVVQFAARTVSISGGTVTTTDTTGESLIDSAATFITDGVAIGASLINFTDRSVATVLLVVSETEITCEPLDDGVIDEFTTGDVYKIWNIVQCNATGGNLTALDEFGVTINAILPSFGTQIVLTAASSATLQEQADIQYSSFQNGVWVDVINGVTGTAFPTGTPRRPSSNLTDAQSIADTVGLKVIYVLESLTIAAGPTHEDMLFIGRSPKTTTITIDAAADVTDCEYQDALVTGTLDGKCYITSCAVKNLLFISGHLERCILREGTITLQGAGIGMFNRCSSVSASAAGVDIPEIDFSGSGQTLALQGFDGSIRLKNKTGTEPVEINLAAGKVWIDADVTAGILNIRGVGEVVDSSVGATVVTDGLLNPAVIADAIWDRDLTLHNVVDTAGEMIQSILATVRALLGLV
jgi:hypothetical protein